ncbi:hypothetical protein [Gemella sanguinis]|uniref:hypothetical protein n=1 Tax=Gemella sanguinis TaxID=84135 RepID=UPI0028ED7820|nr:hypothetical protein [Gemella sanguinis]
MIKRIGLALLLLLIGLLLPSPNYFIGDKNKTYDNEFINSLAKGLNNRWGIVYLNDKDKVKDKDKDKESIKDFRDYIDCELIEIDKYNNRNFKDSKLKEFANAYINNLKETKEAILKKKSILGENFVDSTFTDEWYKYQRKRYELLLDINSIVEIPVKNKKSLNKILKSGKEIKEFNRVYGILVDTFKPEDFEVENVRNEKRYIGNFENTTGYDVGHIYLTIHFYDEKDEGVFSISVEPEGIWKNGTKKSFEFPIYDSDKEFKYFKIYISKKNLRLNRKGYSLEY